MQAHDPAPENATTTTVDVQTSADATPKRELSWRERNTVDKAVAKARKQLERARQMQYRNMSLSEQRGFMPRPGAIVSVAGTSYIVQRSGEYRRVKDDDTDA